MNPTNTRIRPGATSRRMAFLAVALLGCLVASPARAVLNPINTNSSQFTRDVLSRLESLKNQTNPVNKIISGQMVCDSTSYVAGNADLVVGLHQQTGQWAGLLGFDYCDEPLGPMGNQAALDAITQQAKDQWNRGGLVMVIPHFGNPWRKGIPDTTTDKDGNIIPLYPNYRNVKGSTRADGTSALDRLYSATGSVEYNNFRADLNTLATELGKLKAANVVVLFNPFPENNGGDFWWSYQGPYQDGPGNPGPAPTAAIADFTTKYSKLWEYVFNFLTVTKGLNNLLFVWSPAGGTTAPGRSMAIKANSDKFYPQVPVAGTNPVQYKKYVDIVGFDYYVSDQTVANYGRLHDVYVNLQTYGRPVGICQTGRSAPIVNPAEEWDNMLNILELAALHDSTNPGVVFFQNWKGRWSIMNTAQSVATGQWAMMTHEATYNAGDGGLHGP